MAREVGSGGVAPEEDERSTKKLEIARPAARLVDLTNYFSEACGGRETQGVETTERGENKIRMIPQRKRFYDDK